MRRTVAALVLLLGTCTQLQAAQIASMATVRTRSPGARIPGRIAVPLGRTGSLVNVAPLFPALSATLPTVNVPVVSHSPFGAFAEFSRRDRGGRNGGAVPNPGPGKPARPLLPPGARGVEVHTIRTVKDVERVLPRGDNAEALYLELRAMVREMTPYNVHVYTDAFGGTFVAIDLSRNPGLVDIMPGLHPHERALIRLIQARNGDVQVMVPEKGKTPDLIIGGVIVELKTDKGKLNIAKLIDKANKQIYEHAGRHGLGYGGLAMHLEGYDRVPLERILADINEWSRTTKKVVLNRIYIFGNKDLRVFDRRADGSYRLGDPHVPFVGDGLAAGRRDIQGISRLIDGGFLDGAQAVIIDFENRSDKGSAVPLLARVRERFEAQRAYLKIRKLVLRGDYEVARALWANFLRTHTGFAAATVSYDVKKLLNP